MLGEFEDDYGIRYSITDSVWFQHPSSRYHIMDWELEDQFLVARADSANAAAGGLWTRIDWVELEAGGEYEWAFCYAAYDAGTAEQARSVESSNRAEPRVGCNTFPFSRMRRIDAS